MGEVPILLSFYRDFSSRFRFKCHMTTLIFFCLSVVSLCVLCDVLGDLRFFVLGSRSESFLHFFSLPTVSVNIILIHFFPRYIFFKYLIKSNLIFRFNSFHLLVLGFIFQFFKEIWLKTPKNVFLFVSKDFHILGTLHG